MKSQTIHVRNDLAELARVAGELERFCEDLPPATVAAMQLAVDEALTNIISYALPGAPSGRIAIRMERAADELVIEIEDDGPPFDPSAVPPPNLEASIEERALGGLGLHLVRRSVDRFEYRRQGDCNVLTLAKRIAGGVSDRGQATETTAAVPAAIRLSGHIDAANAGEVESRLLAALARQPDELVVDCHEVSFVGSAGLRAFLIAAKRVRARGGVIRLIGLRPAVRQVFEMTGLAPLFSLS